MSARGSITLGELQGKLELLEIACRRCERRGLLRLDRLIAEHGAGMGLPVLGQILASEWPLRHLGQINDRLRSATRQKIWVIQRRSAFFPYLLTQKAGAKFGCGMRQHRTAVLADQFQQSQSGVVGRPTHRSSSYRSHHSELVDMPKPSLSRR